MGVPEIQPQMGDSHNPPVEALHLCIYEGNLPKLRQLLTLPTVNQDLNQQDGHWGTPLHVATCYDNLAAVDTLLRAGADPLLPLNNARGLSPLTLAALNGRRDILQRFWRHVPPEKETHPNTVVEVWGSGFVHAATYGQVSIVAELLDWWDGWSADVKDAALLYAAGRWQVHVVDVLLSKCEFHFKTFEQALHKAAGFKFPLYEEEERSGAIRYEGVDYLDQQQLLSLLLDERADANDLWHKQHLTLLTASYIDLAGALKVVLEAGADPNAANDGGQSALHLLASPIRVSDQDASCRLHETGIRLLLRRNASVTRRDEAGEAPVHWAAFGSNLHIFRLYLEACRMDMMTVAELRNHHGEGLLHFAAAGGKTDIMELLISYGMDVNEQNSNGWTPLMCALARTRGGSSTVPEAHVKSLSQAVRAARLLLNHGADPVVSTDEGWNPLHLLAVYPDGDEEGEAAELAKEFIFGGVDPKACAPLLDDGPVGSSAKAALMCTGYWGHRQKAAVEGPAGRQSMAKPKLLAPLDWATKYGALGVVKALGDGVDALPRYHAELSAEKEVAELE
ncbi:hypothetical protein ACO1O0_002567 [Amphichorda felina]